ncbi:MAG TPA: rhodoquinone biosynthesis methyltransferase RquA [Usitatibacter sp.]|nr:rhodoquinone biosynthesis methyltransferase RquA [Usitatibacter sp.]
MPPAAAVPQYLNETYWWAYVHPNAVKLFERQWLVNLILWGNFRRLRDTALDALGESLPGKTLQVACVYGDFTPKMAERIPAGEGSLDVVDVLPIQLSNLGRKLPEAAPVRLHHRDASSLGFDDASYERVVLFFLLHEMPLDVRRRTLEEAVRVLKPGGQLVVVDYHRPSRWHPLRGVMKFILRNFEPFALDLWNHEVGTWLPGNATVASKATYWGGLYQKLVIVPKGETHEANRPVVAGGAGRGDPARGAVGSQGR